MKVLIVKTSSLGDIIHAFPVAAFLKERNPSIQIEWVVEGPFGELVQAHPYISTVYPVHTKLWRKGRGWGDIFRVRRLLASAPYDVVFDLQGNTKSALATYWANSNVKVGYSKRLVFERPNLWVTTHQYDPPEEANVREENLFLARSYFKDFAPFHDRGVRLMITSEQEEYIEGLYRKLPSCRKVMVCPGSSWPNKQMELGSMVQFLKRMRNTYFILIWGSSKEREVVEELGRELSNCTVIDRLSLPVLQNFMWRMDEVIAMDSLPLHLAATTGVSTYSIFGASCAQKYKPVGMQHRFFQGVCPYGESFSRRCSKLRTCKTGACIRGVSGDEVYADYSRGGERGVGEWGDEGEESGKVKR